MIIENSASPKLGDKLTFRRVHKTELRLPTRRFLSYLTPIAKKSYVAHRSAETVTIDFSFLAASSFFRGAGSSGVV